MADVFISLSLKIKSERRSWEIGCYWCNYKSLVITNSLFNLTIEFVCRADTSKLRAFIKALESNSMYTTSNNSLHCLTKWIVFSHFWMFVNNGLVSVIYTTVQNGFGDFICAGYNIQFKLNNQTPNVVFDTINSNTQLK